MDISSGVLGNKNPSQASFLANSCQFFERVKKSGPPQLPGQRIRAHPRKGRRRFVFDLRGQMAHNARLDT